MTYDEFKNDILNAIKNKHPQWRDGQIVFNYIHDKYNVAKDVAIKDNVDCFYNDNNIEKFIELSYKRI